MISICEYVSQGEKISSIDEYLLGKNKKNAITKPEKCSIEEIIEWLNSLDVPRLSSRAPKPGQIGYSTDDKSYVAMNSRLRGQTDFQRVYIDIYDNHIAMCGKNRRPIKFEEAIDLIEKIIEDNNYKIEF